MTDQKHEFRLKADEWKYLTQLASCDEKLTALLALAEGVRGPRAIIRLSRVDSERLREFLTTQLATVGFDENYSPNEQGEMLEELIEKFYVP